MPKTIDCSSLAEYFRTVNDKTKTRVKYIVTHPDWGSAPACDIRAHIYECYGVTIPVTIIEALRQHYINNR